MKKAIHFLAVGAFIILMFCSCSTQKNKMLNRGYHSLNTRYNVLFNGMEAFNVGQSILEQANEDNFFEFLEVEPIAISGERMDQTTVVPGFDRAEEKAVKAIQKHSMKINGIQRNNKIDEAYLLLGKARYYDRRFFPAMEAFNYLLENYSEAKTYVEGRIWREKTNIRMRNNELAIKNLRSLARTITPSSKFHSQANAAISQAFIYNKKLDSAIYYIRNAALTAKDNRDKGRYYFLSGQLYESLQKPDSALWAYEQVVGLKRKIPRKYWINAHIKRLQIRSSRDSLDPLEFYEKLAKNYENYIFDHWINRAIGIHYFQQQQDSMGEYYLGKSLKSENLDLPTKKANYRDLANFNFASGKYVLAGAYLDSLLSTLPKESQDKRKTQRERDNLNAVIKYENIVQITDSLLYLSGLSKVDQILYFQKYIEEKEALALAKIKTEEKGIFPFFSKSSKANVFYFYNPKLVVQGQQKFLSTWGDRPNTDNWAIASAISSIRENSPSIIDEEKIKNETFFVERPENYVNTLPQSKLEIDSIKKLNQRAYLQLGMIYKESFRNFALAQARLEHLLWLNPRASIAAPALYHLYKINEKGLPKKAKQYYDRLITNHPNSPYTKILINPQEFGQLNLQTPENVYKNLVKIYHKGDFDQLREKAKSFQVLLSGTAVQPKFDLLMANLEGRLHGRKQWNESLMKVVQKYPGSPEAIKALEMIEQIKGSDSIQKKNLLYVNYKWIFTFNVKDTASLKKTKNKLQDALKETPEIRWFLSEDRFDKDQIFLVLHGIRNRRKLNDWKKRFNGLDREILSTNNFVVLSADYKKMLLDKTQFTNEK